MRTIQTIEITELRLPMATPHRTASGVVSESPLVLVDVYTDDGVHGHGLIFTYMPQALAPTAALLRNFAPWFIGQPLAPATLFDQASARLRLLGSTGLAAMALAGIDMALWDALAQASSLPLCRLLGHQPRPIQAYGAIGFDGPDQSAEVARQWASRGFKAVKAKIGYPSVAGDLAVINAIRDVAPDMAIMADYNQSMAPAEAARRLRHLEDLGLVWIEEPTRSHDHHGHGRIAAALSTPVQAGENWWGEMEVRDAIAAGATDFIMLDVMKIGGVTGWVRASALCQAHQLAVSSHLWPEISAQLLSATPTAHWLEYADWWNELMAEPLEVNDGYAQPSERPGNGMAWKADVLKRYRAG